MRVIGSHAISTMPLSSTVGAAARLDSARVSVLMSSPSSALVAREELLAPLAPLRFHVQRLVGDAAEAADHRPVALAQAARELAARWLVHERHELVGEPRHRAADADATDVRTATDAVDPAP